MHLVALAILFAVAICGNVWAQACVGPNNTPCSQNMLLTNPTINGGTITGATVSGGSTSGQSLANPTITGTVSGSPIITSPTINGGTLSGAAFTVAPAVASAGNSQGTATQLTAQTSYITSGSAGTGVTLLANTNGAPQTVLDFNTNNVLVYPPSGAQIDSFGTNNPVTVASTGAAIFRCFSATQCYASSQ